MFDMLDYIYLSTLGTANKTDKKRYQQKERKI